MSTASERSRLSTVIGGSLAFLLGWATACPAQQMMLGTSCQPDEPPQPPHFSYPAESSPPVAYDLPAPSPSLRPMPINLPTALRLANVHALDIAAAAARLDVAIAQLERARVLWLPTVTVGGDYFRHDGLIQSSSGAILNDNFQSIMFGMGSGVGTSAVLSLTDSFFAPLAARRLVQARQSEVQAAANDTMVAVTDAYFTVQQARGELAGAIDATRRAEELVRRTEKLAQGLVAPVEAVRAQGELARRQQSQVLARERWRMASADLVRILRLDPATQVDTVEPPHVQVNLVSLTGPLDDKIALALTLRPELATRQALVQVTLARLRQERARPLIPSVVVRGASTSPSGTLAGGVYAAGTNSLDGSGGRLDLDVQLLWQLDNLGFGNRAKVQERRAENQQALIELSRTRDRVAAEVSQALAQAESANDRIVLAERGLHLSIQSAELNLAGISQTQRSGDLVVLVTRPQEAVAAVQALAQAYVDYYGAIAEFNRAQFRLYRALGNPAQMLLNEQSSQCESPASVPTSVPLPSSTPAK